MEHNDQHISTSSIEKLGELARISLSDEEVAKLEHDVSNILGYVAEVDAIDTSGIELEKPELRNVMREDEITEDRSCAEDVLGQASHTRDGHIVVKKIFQ